MDYNFSEIENKWQNYWKDHNTYKSKEIEGKEPFYVLDMFPYPSGAGLHVGHPLGYIASDIVARFKRHCGYNVLHPMGYDSFGLPAEQYAIQTGQHPRITTEENIATYRRQLDLIGFSFDWDREVRTSQPEYYKWTQWIFIQLFNSWYNTQTDRAEDISKLIQHFEVKGTESLSAHGDCNEQFNAEEWKGFSEQQKADILMQFRLAFISDSFVNWCPALGTVLANDEIKDGVSERGGHPVERKKMKQWTMRITAYAQRLLDGLETIDWSDSLKEIQRNWIGRSQGASIRFKVKGTEEEIEVFTTRPDTVFGASFMVLAPEHDLVKQITTEQQSKEVEAYQAYAAGRSERERMTEVKKVSGAFTGAHVIHPFTSEEIPVWIGDYVLAGYGTGAVMAVPSGDQRDWDFARHFDLNIPPVIEGQNVDEGADDRKDGVLCNSDFLDGLRVNEAIQLAIKKLEEREIGEGKTNYKMRDAVFSRQRYWGEPIPIYFEEGIAKAVPETELPLTLPEVDKYLPTEDGDPPLARATNWQYGGHPLETSTMPGWAGSSWYLFRYMSPDTDAAFADKTALDYWQNVDLYLGGAEHATGHLLYSRFWTKFLFDRGHLSVDEPFKKLINQGMIIHHTNTAFILDIDYEIDHQTIENQDKAISLAYVATNFTNKHQILISTDLVNNFEISNYVKSKIEDYKILFEEHLNNEIKTSKRVKIKKITFEKPRIAPVNTNYVSNDNRLIVDNFLSVAKKELDLYPYLIFDKEFICFREDNVKMSKSKYNVVNPDDVVKQYGADTLRLFEMFLGPLEQSKPWDTSSIEGVHRFLRKFWKLFHADGNAWAVIDEKANANELKVLHKTIKKVTEDIERYSFNTAVSAFMICVNELNDLNCKKKEILEPLCVLLAPFAPHVAEELWEKLGNSNSITAADYPKCDVSLLVESSHKYPISFNGKVRFTLEFRLDMSKESIEQEVLAHDNAKKWLEGKSPKKVIVVPKRIVNIVV